MKESLKDYTVEELKTVVDKFKEYEVGIPFAYSIPFDEANKISSVFTWPKLVYPRKDSKGDSDKFSKSVLNIRNAAINAFTKAVDNFKKNAALPVSKGEKDPNVAYELKDDKDEYVSFTYEEIALLLYAAYLKRAESEEYLAAKEEFVGILKFEEDNKSKDEVKEEKKKAKEELLKKFKNFENISK
jgi:hypothetical protein